MQEFELIRQIFRNADYAQPNAQIVQSIGDDCALLNIPAGQQLAVTTDSLLEHVHFPADADPFLLGQRALAVAVSDLAAAGAVPLAFTLALSLPHPDVAWLQCFSRGLAAMAQQCHIRLVGGDTTAGPLNIGITAMGCVPQGCGLLRSGATAGELLFVSGPLGAAAAALRLFKHDSLLSADTQQQLLDAFWTPQPQLALGQWLRGKAGAVQDISDGLLADAAHIAHESGVQLCIEQHKVPLAQAAVACDAAQALNWALTGGDDYQLLFTLTPAYQEQLQHEFPQAVCIGYVQVGQGLQLVDDQGRLLSYTKTGYQHFG